uniref:Fucosyltransferase n=1 Tax=Angiostrongylus cantonensis TaxID=6313 RepID=A0A0K0D126_ANGCA
MLARDGWSHLEYSQVVSATPRMILSWNAGHSQENLAGCLDWNCQIIYDRRKQHLADAVLFEHSDSNFERTRSDQYVIYFSQESPAHAGVYISHLDYFNFSLGFRHDTPASSPYGYTVKLAEKLAHSEEVIDMATVNGKKKGAAWFVSNCHTHSMREDYVNELKKHFPVDIYGECGSLKCARGSECEKMLDDDYHFYLAFENSLCKDYITEKLWNQGYQRTIVPIVLKIDLYQRSIVERFVPPHSFIAADDFESPKEMAKYLHYLMNNKTAYAEFFSWRREYKVVFLNGKFHDVLERPWGFCQICRILWKKPKPKLSIASMSF